jgi:hypothetical protein
MNLRELMTPKSEEEILNSLKKLSNSDLLQKSIENKFLKGIELALQKELIKDDIFFIKNNLFTINNKEVVRLLLNKIKDYLTEEQIYLIEKYKLRLHQDIEKDYEIWFKEQLTDLNISRSTENTDILIYKKDEIYLYKYDERFGYFYIDASRIWSVFGTKYYLKYNEIKLLAKSIVEEHINLNGIITEYLVL